MKEFQLRRHDSLRLSALFGNRLDRTAMSPFVIGVLNGEGIGREVMAATLNVLSAIDTAGHSRFEIQIGGAIGREAEPEQGRLTKESEAFCKEVFSRRGVIFTGPGEGR